ncbi:MAG: glycosyltransferase family 4 protein [Nitrospiraceae bacterium]|nr:glycosyltransferase family 4 protein [Nitrospiraceae bacterium]
MKILLINKYLYPKGGDAKYTLATGKLLSEKGHEVFYWGMDHPENQEFPFRQYFVPYIDLNGNLNGREKLRASLNIFYSSGAKKKLAALLKKIKPDLVHLNNFAHQLSPSILDAVKGRKIPAVMTMHDYKMVCPCYTMFSGDSGSLDGAGTSGGSPCERCGGGKYFNCVVKKCTKGSVFKSLVNACEMYLHHHVLKIYGKIDLYISPSRFLMQKVKEMGFPWEVCHLPNFADLSGVPAFKWESQEIAYAGRFSHEKGVHMLLDAVKGSGVKLKIIGDGPLAGGIAEKIKKEKLGENVRMLGYLKGHQLQREIIRSAFLVVSSTWYENNPLSIIEAFSLGKPVLGARIGGIPELVRDGETGFTFEAGNAADLRDKINRMLREKQKLPEMGKRAREFAERYLDPEIHYHGLTELYGKAIEINRARR